MSKSSPEEKGAEQGAGRSRALDRSDTGQIKARESKVQVFSFARVKPRGRPTADSAAEVASPKSTGQDSTGYSDGYSTAGVRTLDRRLELSNYR